jgi:hypothetical protein
MDHSFLVSRFESLGHLAEEGNGFTERNRAARDALGESRAGDQLHHQKVSVPLLLEAVKSGDVGVIERGEKTGFPFEASAPFRGIREHSAHDFDGHVAPELGVGRPIDLSHSPRADFLDDAVVAETLPDHGSEVNGELRSECYARTRHVQRVGSSANGSTASTDPGIRPDRPGDEATLPRSPAP